MTLLCLGLALWIAAHFFKRLAPAARAAVTARIGKGAKGVVAAAIGAGLILMIAGYRDAGEIPLYDPPSLGRHLAAFLMLVAVVLFGTGHSKSRLRGRLRHPMLLGTLAWAVAHLLANGDLASMVLFGGLGLWALAEIRLVDAGDGPRESWSGGTIQGDIRLAVIALVAFAAIAVLHAWLGAYPFGA